MTTIKAERRPERHAGWLRQEIGEPLAVAGDVIFGEFVRDRLRHREVDEGDQRQCLGGGVIDRDLVRRPELREDDDVAIGEQKIEASTSEIGVEVVSHVRGA